MATNNIDLSNEIILKNDLYKQNTLLLKRGSVLDAHLISKLNKFGVYHYDIQSQGKTLSSVSLEKEILILQSDIGQLRKTKKILNYAGFANEKILTTDSKEKLLKSLSVAGLKYIFLDSIFYSQELISQIFLNMKSQNVKIFVLNCSEDLSKEFSYNTDYQFVKFLSRPLANSYIKALLRIYS